MLQWKYWVVCKSYTLWLHFFYKCKADFHTPDAASLFTWGRHVVSLSGILTWKWLYHFYLISSCGESVTRDGALGRCRDFHMENLACQLQGLAGGEWHSCLVSFNFKTQFTISSSTTCWPPIKPCPVRPQWHEYREIPFSTVLSEAEQNGDFAFALVCQPAF